MISEMHSMPFERVNSGKLIQSPAGEACHWETPQLRASDARRKLECLQRNSTVNLTEPLNVPLT